MMDKFFSFATVQPMLTRFIVFCTVLLASSGFAAEQTVIDAFEDYFNTLTTYEADFVQWDASAELEQRGMFRLERPRKFNWTYTGAYPQRVISTGSRMFYIDDVGGQVTQIPLNVGLAAVLTQETLDLDGGDLQVLNTAQDDETLQVTVQPAYHDDGANINATVTLVMQQGPRRLIQMITTNPLGQQTIISFHNIRQGQPLDASLFAFEPPQEDTRYAN